MTEEIDNIIDGILKAKLNLEADKKEMITNIIKKKNSGLLGWFRKKFGYEWNEQKVNKHKWFIPALWKIQEKILDCEIELCLARLDRMNIYYKKLQGENNGNEQER